MPTYTLKRPPHRRVAAAAIYSTASVPLNTPLLKPPLRRAEYFRLRRFAQAKAYCPFTSIEDIRCHGRSIAPPPRQAR